MSSELPPVPHKIPVLTPAGVLSQTWNDFMLKLFNRAGGHSARTNAEIDEYISTTAPYLIPTGGSISFGGSVAPTGWLLCDGSAVSRTTYAALFAVIGTAFGVGNGTTTFNLPASGKFAVSKDSGTFSTIGATGGAESVALPNHIHSVNIQTGTPSATSAGTGAGTVASSDHTHGVNGNTGNPTTNPSIATLPPYQVFNRIIKT